MYETLVSPVCTLSSHDYSLKDLLLQQHDRLYHTYQLGRGHPILRDVSLQISRQLQGHLTYFFPAGGFLIGYEREIEHIWEF